MSTSVYVLAGLTLILTGCGDPPGATCELRSGAMGFGFADDCRHTCLARHRVVCPDARESRPAVCSGPESCTPGSCPTGQACYAIPDPFEAEAVCVPTDVCDADLSVEATAAWEAASHGAAADQRESMRSKRQTPAP